MVMIWEGVWEEAGKVREEGGGSRRPGEEVGVRYLSGFGK